MSAPLGLGAVGQQRRQAVAQGDGQLLGHQRVPTRLLPPRPLVGVGQALAPAAAGHVQAGQPGGVERPLEREGLVEGPVTAGVVGGHVGPAVDVTREEGTDPGPELLQFGLHPTPHR